MKIGYSADLMKRLAALHLANAGELRLLRVIDGGPATERWLHKRFASRRMGGEWFEYHPDMMTIVPPDELPGLAIATRKLRPTLAETLRNLDVDGLLADHPRLLAAVLVQAMWDDDIEAFLGWVRARAARQGGNE